MALTPSRTTVLHLKLVQQTPLLVSVVMEQVFLLQQHEAREFRTLLLTVLGFQMGYCFHSRELPLEEPE